MDGNGYKLELYVAASPAYSLKIQVLTVRNCHVLLFAPQLKNFMRSDVYSNDREIF